MGSIQTENGEKVLGEPFLRIRDTKIFDYNNSFCFEIGKYDKKNKRVKIEIEKPPQGIGAPLKCTNRWMYIGSDHEFEFLKYCEALNVVGAKKVLETLASSSWEVNEKTYKIKLSQRLRIQARKQHSDLNIRNALGLAATKLMANDYTIDVRSDANGSTKRIFRIYHTDEQWSFIGYDDFTINEVGSIEDCELRIDGIINRKVTRVLLDVSGVKLLSKVKNRWLYFEDNEEDRLDEYRFLQICADEGIHIGKKTVDFLEKTDAQKCCDTGELETGDGNKCGKCRKEYRSGEWTHKDPSQAVHRFFGVIKKARSFDVGDGSAVMSDFFLKHEYTLDVFVNPDKTIKYTRLWHKGIMAKLGIGYFKTDKFIITEIKGPYKDGDMFSRSCSHVRLNTSKYDPNWFQKDFMRDACDRMLYWREGESSKFLKFLIDGGVSAPESVRRAVQNVQLDRRRLSSSLLNRLADAQFPRETSSPIALHD